MYKNNAMSRLSSSLRCGWACSNSSGKLRYQGGETNKQKQIYFSAWKLLLIFTVWCDYSWGRLAKSAQKRNDTQSVFSNYKLVTIRGRNSRRCQVISYKMLVPHVKLSIAVSYAERCGFSRCFNFFFFERFTWFAVFPFFIFVTQSIASSTENHWSLVPSLHFGLCACHAELSAYNLNAL